MNQAEQTASFLFLLCVSLLFSIMTAVSAYTIRAREEGRRPAKGCRYHSYLSNMLFAYLPLVAAILFIDIFLGDEPDLSQLPPLIVMGIFQCVLLALQPLLRKVFTARTCASLWTLLSLMLFFLTRITRIGQMSLWTIPLPLKVADHILPGFLYIWIAGFAGIMIWHTVNHVLYRRRLLKNARPADAPIIHIWTKEEALANIPVGSYRVLTAPEASTPLSIGLFRTSLVVVLPEKEYTEEELKLILRHELIHICRRDSLAKFSILFLTALFWFNPLMWIAMRCCADDLELSCDETVLHGYDKDIRLRYANLLLNTAADQKGFTTCLSASARALRYRLKNVIVPRKRLTGGILVGVLCLLMFLGCSFVNFSYDPGTVQEHVFQNGSAQEYVILDGTIATGELVTHVLREDNPVLTEYLFQLQVSPLMKESSFRFEGQIAQIVIDGQDMKHTLYIRDGLLWVRTLSKADNGYDHCYYRINEPLDWAYLCETMEIYR